MNAYQKDKVERSLTLLRYLQAVASEVQEHCKKHRRETHTICTQELINQLADGQLLYIVERKHDNKDKQYEAVRFNECLRLLILDLETELRLMGGKEL